LGPSPDFSSFRGRKRAGRGRKPSGRSHTDSRVAVHPRCVATPQGPTTDTIAPCPPPSPQSKLTSKLSRALSCRCSSRPSSMRSQRPSIPQDAESHPAASAPTATIVDVEGDDALEWSWAERSHRVGRAGQRDELEQFARQEPFGDALRTASFGLP